MMTITENETESKKIIDYFTMALKEQRIDPDFIQWRKEGTGKNMVEFNYSLEMVFCDVEDFTHAMTLFQQKTGSMGKWNGRLDETERTYIIAKVILLCLINNGKFIKDQFNQYYYFNKIDDSVTLVCESKEKKKIASDFESYIQNSFNLRKIYKNIQDKILNYVIEKNESMNIYRLWFFDKSKNILFVYAGGKQYFKLDGEHITVHTNGEEILFKESDSIVKKKYLPLEQRRDIGFLPGLYKKLNIGLFDFLVNRVNFTQDSNLSPDEQRVQLIIHILVLPFSSIIHTKPIVITKGDTGSGKSFVWQTIGKFFFGDKYALSCLPKDIKDYTTALINRPVYFTDNVDKYCDWLAELIVAISTGARLPQRGLYTDHDLIENLPECFLSFTTRTGTSFKRDDVIDRSLLFHIDEIELKLNPIKMWEPLEFRDEFFSEYLDILNQMVLYIKNKDFTIRTTHRIAGWVKLGHIINNILNLEELYDIKFSNFLDHIHNEKAVFSFTNKRIIKLLRIFCSENPNEWFYGSQIVDKIEEIDPDFNMDSSKLGKLLNTQAKQLNRIFGMEIDIDRSRKVKKYKFGKSEDKNKSSCIENDDNLRGHGVKSHSIPLCMKNNNIDNSNVISMGTLSTPLPRKKKKNRKKSEHSPILQEYMKEVEEYLSDISRVDGVYYDDLKKYFIYYKKWEEPNLQYILDQMWDVYGSINKLAGNRYQINE